ncbi:MAG TPA: hypothetical protein VKD08_10120 [Ignavibacteriaceae bacterium]|nr:hypothetical protein [Ignavibacteriaceae bacterium]
MKFSLLAAAGILLVLNLSGCIDFYKVSYEINLETSDKGTAIVHLYDLRSDAEKEKDFETDKENIFQFALKSDDFLQSMKQEGKNIQSRQLFASGDTLNANVVYTFDSITSVENMQHDAGFFYLTLEPTDSVIATNGEIISSKDRKRILWDKSMKTLTFEILSNTFTGKAYKMLGPYYKP